MQEELQAIQASALEEVARTGDLKDLENTRVKFLGRKGLITEVLRGLADVSVEDRPALGKTANDVKQAISDAIDSRKQVLEDAEASRAAQRERVDLSLPGRQPRAGHHHVVSQVVDEIVDVFQKLGFQVASEPYVESQYYNFDSLNTPADHPARDSHDTFFVKPGVVLRTHTSPVQMRVMEKTKPPVAVVVPGRVYRVDQDASHSPMFWQVEGLLVDQAVSFADLKGTLMSFIHRFFGPNTKIRFRPHFFPFTEPSAEVDISCAVCGGGGCRVCKHSGWL